MKHHAWLVLVWLFPAASLAQPVDRSEQQVLGARLFNKSCVLCHKNPQITAGQYGPVLSTATLGGKEDVMREVISDGTPRMPGFKYQFSPDQIAAVAAYIKTIPAPAATVAPTSGKPNVSRDAD
jgi:mono/diheme cytochrome c family protein